MAASAIAVHAGAYQRLAVAGRMTAGPLSIRGFNSSVTRKTWEKCNQHGQLDNAPVARGVLVTHLTPGSRGLRRLVVRVTHAVELYMTRDEYLLCRILVSDTGLPAPREGTTLLPGRRLPQKKNMTRYERDVWFVRHGGRTTAPGLPPSA